jgi:hypothetical protein
MLPRLERWGNLVGHIWLFIRQGWKLLAEIHLATWLIEVVAQVPTAFISGWAWIIGLPGPVTAAIAIVLAAVMFLIGLGVSGAAFPDRVPLFQLRELCAFVGWNTIAYYAEDAYELTSRLNQAGADGKLTFWGRRWSASTIPVAECPLIEIPKKHFRSYSFDSSRLFGSKDNFHIWTGKPGKSPYQLKDEIYRDLHVDRHELAAWIKRNKKLA